MNFGKCNNCGNQVNSDDNICSNCGNTLNQNISNSNNQQNMVFKKKMFNFLKIVIGIIIGFVLGITPLLFKEIKQLDKINQENNIIIEDTENEDTIGNVIDDKPGEKIKNDEIEKEVDKEEQNQSSNNSNSSNNNVNNSNSSNNPTNNNSSNNNSNTNNNTPNDEDVSKEESIIGTWLYEEDEEKIVFIFTDDKFTIITPKMNTISEQNYRIDENRIILNEKEFVQYEIKNGILFWGFGGILKKQDENFVYPSIYYNHNIFYGTWRLENDTKTIMLENGMEKELYDEIVITPDDVSGYKSCGGVGCNPVLINFNNSNPELYLSQLCYELIDKNTLKQIKCQSDSINGYPQWENETLHNIIYKRVN